MSQSGFVELMAFNDQTFESAAENIAAEQALLDTAESRNGLDEILRLWKPAHPMVVLGRGGKVNDDVYLAKCRADDVPVLRRISGGGTIISGPGCLMYTVVLSLSRLPQLRDIAFCHQFVGEKLTSAYRRCGHEVELKGHSDLCVGDKKFSGNALRIGRTHLIYHGTLLVDFDLKTIPYYLKHPPRQPGYRESRDHLDFVTNLEVDINELQSSIETEFGVGKSRFEFDGNEIHRLVAERYSRDEWNLRL